MFVQDNQNNQSASNQPSESNSQSGTVNQPASNDYVTSYQPPANPVTVDDAAKVEDKQPQPELKVEAPSETPSTPAEPKQKDEPEENQLAVLKNSLGKLDQMDMQALDELEKLIQEQKQKMQPQVEPQEAEETEESVVAPPPLTAEPTGPIAQEQESKSLSEKLEDQNIFFLLGVEDGKPEEKERFLDELQQVIWEDFLETDLDLLITSQEKERVDQMLAESGSSDLEKQEQVIEFLSGIIPDLEEIMLEKALELKQDMVKERVAGMKEYYKEQSDALAKIEQASNLFTQGKWASGAKLLNELV